MVAIKNMEKIPKSCLECPSRMLNKCFHLKSSYELKGFNIFEEKPKGCPLVEIITCKDCKHWVKDLTSRVPEDKEYHFCPMIDCNTSENFYCADAERKG